jgi:hypothetical protein
MHHEEERRILDILRDDFPAVSEAIKDPRQRFEHEKVVLGVYLTEPDMTLELFDRFRETDWVICYTPIRQPVGTGDAPPIVYEYTMVSFLRAVPVTLPETCYHVTGAENEANIGKNGLQIGALCGKESRGQFADSRFYVNVSELKYVSLWTGMLYTGQPALVFPVNTVGLRFIQDPHCHLAGTEVNGYILVGKAIEPDRLGDPKRTGPPATAADSEPPSEAKAS